MNEGTQELQDRLLELLMMVADMALPDLDYIGLPDWLERADVRSFEDAAILTYNKGIVLSLKDGSEFQLTIVRSK